MDGSEVPDGTVVGVLVSKTSRVVPRPVTEVLRS